MIRIVVWVRVFIDRRVSKNPNSWPCLYLLSRSQLSRSLTELTAREFTPKPANSPHTLRPDTIYRLRISHVLTRPYLHTVHCHRFRTAAVIQQQQLTHSLHPPQLQWNSPLIELVADWTNQKCQARAFSRQHLTICANSNNCCSWIHVGNHTGLWSSGIVLMLQNHYTFAESLVVLNVSVRNQFANCWGFHSDQLKQLSWKLEAPCHISALVTLPNELLVTCSIPERTWLLKCVTCVTR